MECAGGIGGRLERLEKALKTEEVVALAEEEEEEAEKA